MTFELSGRRNRPDWSRLGLTAMAAVQMLSWPLAQASVGGAGVHDPGWAQGLHGVAAVTLLAAVLWLWIDRAPQLRWVFGALAAVLLLAGGLVTLPGYGASYAHPTFACAVGILTLGCVRDWRRGWWSVVGGLAAYLIGAWATVALGARAVSAVGSEIATLVGVPLALGWLAHTLVGLRRRRHTDAVELADARRQLAAGQAREEERTRQYRTLHDTVLSTLSALARGTIDLTDPGIRHRLSAESDYLRGLIATSSSTAGMQLVGVLATITREQASAGLRVHPHIAEVPDELPAEVVTALGGGIREALNNVVKHSGRLEAWVTIVGEPRPDGGQGISVMIADRGRGFDPHRVRPGIGLSQSLRARMAEVGGAVEVDSQPQEGTTVELRWPA